MKFTPLEIPGLVLIEPNVFKDSRGYFFESFNKHAFHNAGILDEFVQDNQSLSQKGVLRGLHFQLPPFAQSKLVRVIQGAVYDVAVDIRKNSPTYGKHVKVLLSENNKNMLFVPVGFAHGFITLEDNTLFSYKCGNVYHKQSESGLPWNDDSLKIEWEFDQPILSEKDMHFQPFNTFESPFNDNA